MKLRVAGLEQNRKQELRLRKGATYRENKMMMELAGAVHQMLLFLMDTKQSLRLKDKVNTNKKFGGFYG